MVVYSFRVSTCTSATTGSAVATVLSQTPCRTVVGQWGPGGTRNPAQ